MSIPRIVWTEHATKRLAQRGLTRGAVERAVRERHPLRTSNVGEADWRIDAGAFVVIYDHPHAGMADAVLIVTVWAKRGGRKRHLELLPQPAEGYPDR